MHLNPLRGLGGQLGFRGVALQRVYIQMPPPVHTVKADPSNLPFLVLQRVYIQMQSRLLIVKADKSSPNQHCELPDLLLRF